MYKRQPLQDEIKNAKGYLEMQRLMYRDCFYVYMDIPEELQQYPVPQMILHTFLENIFKHVISIDSVSYTHLDVYKRQFMDNVDYPAWSKYLIQLLKEYQVEDGLVLDLGCGTGNMTELLAKEGYDMIGVDNSEDMLEIASEKRAESGLNILYLLQDMREFELYGTVKAVVSICDSINYILEEDDLREVFSLVNNYLDPKGMFIFDLNTKYKYEQMGETTIAENREEASFIWDNYYDPEEEINEYELAIFIPEGEDSDLYRKFEEVHYQRAYDLATIRRLLEEAGMEFVTAYDAFTKDAPRPESERIYVVAREKGKSEK